ncbi:hypothetical protein [Haloimpatiens massiliensis]|uniref:hypothetical protein n=1 Tax=Haloimpatiens massiliensis TaxID=1658110 RepID=UPI000C821913|nr:hypothetical protein [Haloimpatiens massiliensis]
MKQYYPDPKLKRKLQRTQYKKHPKWHKRKWVRRILLLLAPIGGILSFFRYRFENGMFAQDGVDGIVRVTTAVSMGIFASIPYFVYRKALEGSCECVVNYREHDTVVITDEDIKYIYHPSNRDNIKLFHQFEIKFNDITKMIYNTYHQRVDIYGKQKEIYYSDVTTGEIGRTEEVDKPDERIRLYLYFEGNEEIVKTLEEKSGVQMEKRDYPEE